MTDTTSHGRAVELLQQLGLKEYEARCFVALTRLPDGTAKEISEISEVPRTRVYDAIRVLESDGLVEVQHASPKRFRAVSLEEALDTLRYEFESTTDDLAEALRRVDPVDSAAADDDVSPEVWSLSGRRAIANRTRRLLDEAEREVLFVVDSPALLTEATVDAIDERHEMGVDVAVRAVEEPVPEHVPGAGNADLEWLTQALGRSDDGVGVRRLLLVDGETVLVSTTTDGRSEDGGADETCVVGVGVDNSIVALLQRLVGGVSGSA